MDADESGTTAQRRRCHGTLTLARVTILLALMGVSVGVPLAGAGEVAPRAEGHATESMPTDRLSSVSIHPLAHATDRNTRLISLTPPPEADLARSSASATNPGSPRQIGLTQPIAGLPSDSLDLSTGWAQQNDGRLEQYFGFQTEGATGIRIGFDVELPDADIRFDFYDREDRVFHSVSAKSLAVRGLVNLPGASDEDRKIFWSPAAPGSYLGVRITLPQMEQASAMQALRVRPVFMSYLTSLPGDPANEAATESGTEVSGSCNLDAVCSVGSERHAVARIIFTTPEGTFQCSGTLLATTGGIAQGHFLTANHCISTAAEAASIQAWWFWEAASCGSSSSSSALVQTYGGAQLLSASDTTDTSLSRLYDAPPSGTWHMGWDAAVPSLNTPVTGIHHPAGDLKKYSYGAITSFASCTPPSGGYFTCSPRNVSDSDANYIDVTWAGGTTEGGSSGSGLFSDVTGAHLGTLYGGNSGCFNLSGDNYYGRFDRAYALAGWSQWLVDDGSAPDPPPATDQTISFFFGEPSNATQTYFLDLEGAIGAEIASADIEFMAVRGDFASSTEYLDVLFTASGQWVTLNGGGDDDIWRGVPWPYPGSPPVLEEVNGRTGIWIVVYPTTDVNFSLPLGGDYWQLQIDVAISPVTGPPEAPVLDSARGLVDALRLNFTPASTGAAATSYQAFCSPVSSGASISQRNDANVSMPDNGAASSAISIAANGIISGPLNVSYVIRHEWRGDLEVTLSAPNGTSAVLFSGNPLDSRSDVIDSRSVSGFEGLSINGDWRLVVTDRATGSTGFIDWWEVTLPYDVQISATGTQSPITVSGLISGNSYSCRVAASNAYGSSPASNTVTQRVGTVPGTPTIVRVEPEDSALYLKVDLTTTGGLSITQYSATCDSLAGSVTATSSSNLVLVEGLTNGVGYICTAFAQNAIGTSTVSAPVKGRPEEQLAAGIPIWLLKAAMDAQSAPSSSGVD